MALSVKQAFEQSTNSREMGRLLGFPECCIEFFHSRAWRLIVKNKSNNVAVKKAHEKEHPCKTPGYIMCPNCYEEHSTGLKTLQEICPDYWERNSRNGRLSYRIWKKNGSV